MSSRFGRSPRLPRVLEHAARRRAMQLANLANDAIDFRVAALGDQGADDAATGRGRAQRRRGHEGRVQIALEPARLDRARRRRQVS